MKEQIKQASKDLWWVMVLTGIIAVIFGLFTFLWPGITLSVLVWMFGACVVIIGLVSLISSLASIKTNKTWWLPLIFSIILLGLGIYMLFNPPATELLFIILLTIFVFAQSVYDLVMAASSKGADMALWIVIGVLGIIFGFVILIFPWVASLAFVWVLGIYALVHGIISLVYAFRIKGEVKKVTKAVKEKLEE